MVPSTEILLVVYLFLYYFVGYYHLMIISRWKIHFRERKIKLLSIKKEEKEGNKNYISDTTL